MNIAAILEAHAGCIPARPAIVEARRRVTFGELNHEAAVAAERLARAGVTAGMRAIVLVPMSVQLYVTVIALFRLGATAVFVDPSAGREHLERALKRVRPDAFLGVRRAHLLRLTSTAVRAVPIKATVRHRPRSNTVQHGPRCNTVQHGPRSNTEQHGIVACDPATPAVITFTSGTTAEPKAVVRTHGFLRAQHAAIVEALGTDPDDRDLTTLPVFVLANLASGITSVIPDADLTAPAEIDAEPVLDQIRRERPTRTVASPALLERLAAGHGSAFPELSTFRRIFTGGAPVFLRTLDALAAAAPAAAIVAVYGSSEAEPIAVIDRQDIRVADRAAMASGAGVLAGRPAPSIQLRIVRDRWGIPLPSLSHDEFEDSIVASGHAGEIVVSGDHVLAGYLDGSGNEETKTVVGSRVWHRTGDAGYLDDEGRLWLLGRCSAKVVDEQGVQYPLPVECAASDVDGIRRSAFMSVRGRRVLIVECRGSSESLRGILLTRLAWAHVTEVILVPKIPVDRRHNAKIDLAAASAMVDALDTRRSRRTADRPNSRAVLPGFRLT